MIIKSQADHIVTDVLLNLAALSGYHMNDKNIFTLTTVSKIAKHFLNTPTGKRCANFAPIGAVVKLLAEIAKTAGQ